MRITSLQIDGLLSFDRFTLALEPDRTIVVGPNGSGKSNLLRALDLIANGVTFADGDRGFPVGTTLDRYEQAHHVGSTSPVIMASIAIEMLEDDEQALFTSFFQSAMLSSALGSNSGPDLDPMLDWITRSITPQTLAPLFTGRVVVGHDGVLGGRWHASYHFDHAGTRYIWRVPENLISDYPTSLSTNSGGRSLIERVGGAPIVGGALKPPSKEFSFAAILPPPGENTMIATEPRATYPTPRPWREFIERASLPTTTTNRSYGLSSVLRRILDTKVSIASSDLRGPFGGGHDLLPQPLVFPVDEMAAVPSSRNPSQLPLRLFRLKNGNRAQRDTFNRIRALFTKLTHGSDIDLVSTFLTSTTTPAATETSVAITLTVRPTIGSASDLELPIQFTGAGRWEALLLAEAIVGSEGRFVILDEPALNLGPGWQGLVLREIEQASGQFLVITHSAYMVPDGPSDQSRVVRFALTAGATEARRSPTFDELRKAKLAKALSSSDARSLFFASAIVLTEGETEFGALPVWWRKSDLNRPPESLNLVVFAVTGDTYFETYVRFAEAYDIPWAIVCDGKALKPGTKGVIAQLRRAGTTPRPPNLAAAATFEDAARAAAQHGVFTLATDWTDNAEAFEAFLNTAVPRQLELATDLVGSSKHRVGRWIALNTECPAAVARLYRDIVAWLTTRGMPA
jgi:ABC-type molybdenum transport system ATPase subunit/photorepair protein PhrA